jgi:hypothetical protein
MFVIFGTRCFGKVDHVPGLFYVSTRFFHINFVPLIPLGSYIIFDGTDRGKPIGLSLKSLGLAWGRWGLVIAGVVCAFIGLAHFGGGLNLRDTGLILIGCGLGVIAVLCAALFIASFFLNKASHDRAMQLADELSWPRHRVARHLNPDGRADDRGRDELSEAEGDYDRRWRERYDDRDDRDRDYDRRRRDRDDERDYDRRERDRDRDYDRRDY